MLCFLTGRSDADVDQAAPLAIPSVSSTTADASALVDAVSPTESKEEQILQQIKALNQIPEGQLSDETEPALSILKTLHTLDAPEFATVRKVLGQAKVRGLLSASARGVLASAISPRWDGFTLAGNLWLGALRSTDPTMRAKARQKLVCFIQTAHIPVLIELLGVPGANTQAYEVLQEVTGQSLPPEMKAWRAWWTPVRGSFDAVAVVLKDTQDQVAQHPIPAFDADRFWYTPEGLETANAAQRSAKDENKFQDWNVWVHQEVQKTVDQWNIVKPALDRLTHQPDPRVSQFLNGLLTDPGYGNYASVVLAWRGDPASLPLLQAAYKVHPTVGRALGRGSLGDKSALHDLLKLIDRHPQPSSLALMDDAARAEVQTLHTVGEIPAEQAFELLAHQSFGFLTVTNKAQKKKSLHDAEQWLKENQHQLTLDRHRGYYITTQSN